MNDDVTLTVWEGRICTWVGQQRRANAKANARNPGLGPPHVSDEFHIRGAHCEFAASILCNLYWRPSIGELHNPDVGGLVEVRSTILADGRLIVKPADDDDAPFVLMLADVAGLRFQFLGWAFARDAKLAPLLTEHGDPGHYVRQGDLEPRSTLMMWLRARV